MKRFATFLVPLTLLLAACSGEDTPAASEVVATVGDATLERDTLIEMLDTVAANDGYIEAVTAQAAQSGITYTVNGDGGPGTYAAEFSTELISQWIFYNVLQQQVAEQELTVDDEARERAEVLASFVYGGQQPPDRSALADTEPDPTGLAILNAFAPIYLDFFIEGVASLLVLEAAQAADISDEAIAEFYETNKASFEQACASHILVSPDPEAADQEAALAAAKTKVDEIAAELADGGDFAAIATERSDDTGSGAAGGELGCGPKGQYVPEFEDVVWSIDLDTVSEPVETQFGYHLILVTERGTATLEESSEQIRSTLEGQSSQGFQTQVQGWVAEADVTVDEDYGIWDAASGIVNVPAGAAAPSTTAPTGGVPEGGGVPVDTLPVITAPGSTVPAGG